MFSTKTIIMKKLFVILILITAFLSSKAQKADCQVLLDSLKGIYEGDCKNGKAEGKGKATGTDIYDGEFKKGLPEGAGKYTWKNGNYYYGSWKKGLKDGKGELHVMENNLESVKKGYWKKDKYVGLHEEPYKIISTTSPIGRVEVNNMDKNSNSVTVTVTNSAGINVTMTEFQIAKGTYERRSNSRLSSSDITTFSDVVFPFEAIFNFGNSTLQIEIYEKGAWEITVPIIL